MPEVSTCRSCGAIVTWVLSPTGKRMPLDGHAINTIEDAMQFTAVYRIVSQYQGDKQTASFRRHEYTEAFNDGRGPLFPSHFSTCPQAGEHSRGKR